MKTRIIVAAVGLPLLLVVLLVLPTVATGILIAAMCVVAVYELLLRTGLVRDIRLVAASALMALFVCLWCSGNRSWASFLAIFHDPVRADDCFPCQTALFGGLH